MLMESLIKDDLMLGFCLECVCISCPALIVIMPLVPESEKCQLNQLAKVFFNHEPDSRGF